jgi:hypothetical protein
MLIIHILIKHYLTLQYAATLPRWVDNFFNILIVFNISNIDKEINKELPEDDLIED